MSGGTPGGAGGNVGGGLRGDPRQTSRELGLRRAEAEAIRQDLAASGGDTREIDQLIRDMRRLEQGALGNPGGMDRMHADLVEGLKTFEFNLWRALNGGEGRPALGAKGQVSPEYRALVEEYYRSLARRP